MSRTDDKEQELMKEKNTEVTVPGNNPGTSNIGEADEPLRTSLIARASWP